MKVSLDNFLSRPRRVGNAVIRLFGYYEKVILAGLAVVIVISGTVWYRQFIGDRTAAPNAGGSYVEGVIGDEQELRQISLRLTKVGFFRYGAEGQLENVLVDSWQANGDSTEYTFTLKQGVDPNEILTDLENNIDILGSATVESNGDTQITIRLSEPNASIPLLLTQPLFEYGPYKLTKATNETTIFGRNPRDGAIRPYLNKVIIHQYKDNETLQKALSKRKIDGVGTENVTIPDGYKIKTFPTPRYLAVIFNINKSPFREAGLRQALIGDNTIPATPFTLTVADQEPHKTQAAQLVERWKARGANVSLEIKTIEEVVDKTAPSRAFQALLIGLDYGLDLDPTYLWSSTQIRPPGNNLSGIKSQAVDQQIAAVLQTTQIKERLRRIDDLHAQLQSEGVLLLVRQETISFIAQKDLVVTRPWLAVTAADRFRSIADWYIR